MKLISLSIENIASLRGKHFLNFEEISQHSDIFAITGPTGAGKSSILTSITMALYGTHHKGLSHEDIVSIGEREGKIALKFNVKGIKYECIWQCTVLKKDGTPLKTSNTQRLFFKEGIELDNTQQAIEDVIGLTYQQFTKSVILNQGDFSVFLTASFAERKRLLEKLLENEGLKDLAPTLRQKIGQDKARIQNLKERSESTNLLSKEEISDLEQQLQKLTQNLPPLEEFHNNLKGLQGTLKDEISLLEEYSRNQENHKNYCQKSNFLSEELNSINESIKKDEVLFHAKKSHLATERPKINEAKKLSLERTTLNNKLIEANMDLQTITAKGTKLKDEINQLDGKSNSLTDEINTLLKSIHEESSEKVIAKTQDRLDEINLLQKRFEVANQNCLNFNTRLKDLKENIKREEIELTKYQKKFDEKITQIKEFKQSISGNIRDNLPISNELLQIEDLGVFLKDFNLEFQRLEIEHERRIKEVKEKNSQIEEIQKEISERSVFLKDQNNTLSTLETKRKKLELTQEELRKNNRLGELYKLALEQILTQENRDECPICHETSRKELPLILETSIKTINEEQKEKQTPGLEFIDQELADVRNQMVRINTIIEEKEAQLSEKRAYLIKFNDEVILLDSQIKQNDLFYKNISSSAPSLEQFNEIQLQLHNLKSRVYQYREQLDKQTTQEAQLRDLVINEHNIILEALTSLKNTPETFNWISSELQALTSAEFKEDFPQKLGNFLERTHKRLKEEHGRLVQLKVKETELRGIQDLIKKHVIDKNELQVSYRDKKKDITDTEKKILEIQNTFSLKELPEEPEVYENKILDDIDKLNSSLEANKVVSNEIQTKYSSLQGQIGLLKEQQKLIETNLIKSKNKLNEILEQLKTSNLQPSILANEHWPILLTKLDHYVEISPQDLREKLTQDQSSISLCELVKSINNERLTPFLDSILDIIQTNKDQLIVCKTRLNEQAKQEEKVQRVLGEIKSIQEELFQFEKLLPFIDRDIFRDFALSILEETLLDLANKEISSLADGRYELKHAKAGKKSELMVKDLWQGNGLRKVSTLSGGETFLLSLGLALGLSELTRGKTEIDAFFIDEGFGTLDDESINQVLDCLMQIKSQGKQIGLISHIRGLTDQIPIRIRLEKDNFGQSNITIQ